MADSFRVIWSKSLILFKSRPKTAKYGPDLFLADFQDIILAFYFSPKKLNNS